jgi:gluconokinase
MQIPGLRAADEKVGGIVHFGRMVDKVRLQAAGTLPEGYFLGDEDPTWWDSRCCRFLNVDYGELATEVRNGMEDVAALEWCFEHGRKPGAEEIQIWNAFILKRGWRDESTAGLQADKRASGFEDREDILTYVELFKAEEA